MRIVYERAAVRVPATTANMGPGFDSFGMAFRYYDEVSVRPTTGTTRVIVEGVGAETVPTDDDNLVVQALRAGLDAVGSLAAMATVFAENGVSINSVRQSAYVTTDGSEDQAVVTFVTHPAPVFHLDAAVEGLRASDRVAEIVSIQRVEGE